MKPGHRSVFALINLISRCEAQRLPLPLLRRFTPCSAPRSVIMGLSFRGLTSSALVANNSAAADAATEHVSHVPASVAEHTSLDMSRRDEKLGAPRNPATTDSDEELTKIDTTAEKGVQNVQAMTYVWSRKDLILAYIA